MHQPAEWSKDRTRVLHLRTVVGRGGGPEKTLLHSHRYGADAFDVRLLYIHPHDDNEFDLPARASQSGAKLTALAECCAFDPRTIAGLIREIRAFRPHVIHAHDYKTDFLAALVGLPFGIPCVATLHGNVTRDRRLNFYYRLDRWVLRRMRRIMVVSRDLRDEVVACGIPTERCVLIENGIDIEHFKRNKSVAEAKTAVGISASAFQLGAIGRLMPEKGFDILIRAVAMLRQEYPQLRLRIAGEGVERSRLEALIQELDCGGQIELLGHLSDVRELLETSDAFVLSSRREAFPNVVLEALAMEVPVVASRIAGIPDLITDGETGLLTEPEDSAALAASIRKQIESEPLRLRLAAAGRALIESRYTFAERMRKEFAVYDELLGAQARQRS